MTPLPISLPDGFTSKVNISDHVRVGQVIAAKNSSSEEIINIPSALSVTYRKAKKTLSKIPGEKVKKGDVLAVKKSFFGGNTVLRSAVFGTVLRYERDSGNLVIKLSEAISAPAEIISPVDGIIKVCDNREIVIDTEKNVIIGEDSVGDKAQGVVLLLQSSDPYLLNSSATERIVVGDKLSREMLVKGVGIGVAGLIGVEIADADLAHLAEKKFKTPVIKIDRKDYERLTEWRDKKVFLNPQSNSIILLSV